MDNLTHSLVGALIGQAGLKRKTGLAMPALIIGANLPDIDATCTIYGIESLAMRRGLTHGPIAWVVLPLVLAGILWWFDRWQAKRGKRPEGRLPVHFAWLFGLAFIACLSHPAFDWLNSYGIRFLEPFSSRWFYGDTLFIIDIWLWLGMGFATWFSLKREKRGRDWQNPARAALALVLAYVLANVAITRHEAADGALYARIDGFAPGEATIIASPVPIAFWQRDLLFGARGEWRRKVEFGPDDGWSPEIVPNLCVLPDTSELMKTRPDLKAFLFWSRAPFVTPSADGKGIIFNDARFYDPLTRGRFAVEVPNMPCEPIQRQK